MTTEQREKCHLIIHGAASAAAAAGGGMAQIPLSDTAIITPIQIGMIISLGAVFDTAISKSTASALLKGAAASFIGRTISQFLVGWIPGFGNAINATTAFSITEGIGWNIAEQFDRDYSLTGRPSGRSLFSTIINDDVEPIRGSIVSCSLALMLDHSGVYVGNNQIIHRDGDGYLAKVSPKTFINRLDGFNSAIMIFVSCKDDHPVGSETVAQRAEKLLNDPREAGYDILSKNCHQFCQYCLTGTRDNGNIDFTFTSLEDVANSVLGMNSWRNWKLPNLFA